MEFSVIYWIRNNFPFLCYLLLLRAWVLRRRSKERNESYQFLIHRSYFSFLTIMIWLSLIFLFYYARSFIKRKEKERIDDRWNFWIPILPLSFKWALILFSLLFFINGLTYYKERGLRMESFKEISCIFLIFFYQKVKLFKRKSGSKCAWKHDPLHFLLN